jgi:tetratricopeptide (TPR) repeat protein
MPDKKRTPLSKTGDKRMSEPEAPKTSKGAETLAAAVSASGAAAVAQPLDSARQLAAFEAAMRLFHARKLREARELFQRSVDGPERDVAQRARLHIAMCDRRLEQTTVSLHSADDYYNYGIALINARNLAAARQHLDTALQMAPGSEHIHYALGVAQALGGDLAEGFENLKRAIELEPRNRLIARQDADLASLAGQPPFDALLYPEKKSW